ncbi:hypothetical protein FOZ62_004235, partial [Perkinsus olseni]
MLDMLLEFLQNIEKARLPDGLVDTYIRLLAIKVIHRMSRSTIGRAGIISRGSTLETLIQEEILLSPSCWLTRRTAASILLEVSRFAQGAARLFDIGYLRILYDRVRFRSSLGPEEERSDVRSLVFEILANIVAVGPSDAGRIAARFPGLPLLIPSTTTNSTLASTLRFLVEVSLVGPEAKEAIAAGTTFTGKVVPLLMSPDSPPGVVDLGWALAASLTVVKSVKYEVWDSGADLFEHALERLGTERPVSHVLRHVIQVVANL